MIDIRKSLFLSFIEKYSSLLIGFGVSMIMARLLTPQQFGVFAIAYALVGFAQIIREMGINSYIIQKTDLSSTDIQACLFLTFSAAWLLAFLLYLAAPLVEILYGDDVRQAVYVLLCNFLILPISSTIFAVLQREMRFDLLLRINLAGNLVNSGCAVILGVAGWGYMSLAWASVAGQIAIAVVAGFCRPHRQHFLPKPHGINDIFRFGSIVMAGTLLQQISTNVANLITARFVSLEDMGLFSRSQSVSSLFGKLILDGAQPLLLPIFSQIHRKDMPPGPLFEQSISYLSIVSWPFFCFLSLLSEPLIVFLFGSQWLQSADLLRFISIGGLFWIVQPIANPLLVALGRVQLVVRIQAVNQLAALVAVVIASTQGIEAVAIAAIPISAFHGAIWLLASSRCIQVDWHVLFRSVCVTGAVTAISLAPPVLLINVGGGLTSLEQTVFSAAGAAVGWLAGVFIFRHPISIEILRFALHARQIAIGRAGV